MAASCTYYLLGLGSKNKRGDRKGESNDSPEIPDRRGTFNIPGLPLGGNKNKGKQKGKKEDNTSLHDSAFLQICP